MTLVAPLAIADLPVATEARTWGDYRTLVGVTDDVNKATGDQDVAQWLPTYDRCRYLGEFVAVKLRSRLTVQRGEGVTRPQ